MENVEVDNLVRLASGLEDGTLGQALIEILAKPSTKEFANHIMTVDHSPSWIDSIFEFLEKGKNPKDKNKSRRIKYQANKYTILNRKLYRRVSAIPYLRCLRPDEAKYIMRKIHEGVCGNHSGKRSLAQKVLRQGYYWATMQKDSVKLVQKCNKCQRFTHVLKQPPKPLSPVINPWPFAKWGIDLIRLLPTTRAQAKFVIVAIDYFTKWVEAKPLSTITEIKCTNFIWRNIICRFRVSHLIITNNEKQFDNPTLMEMC